MIVDIWRNPLILFAGRVYIIDPVWQSSLLALEHDTLITWQYKGAQVNSKSFVFRVHSVGEEVLWIGL